MRRSVRDQESLRSDPHRDTRHGLAVGLVAGLGGDQGHRAVPHTSRGIEKTGFRGERDLMAGSDGAAHGEQLDQGPSVSGPPSVHALSRQKETAMSTLRE